MKSIELAHVIFIIHAFAIRKQWHAREKKKLEEKINCRFYPLFVCVTTWRSVTKGIRQPNLSDTSYNWFIFYKWKFILCSMFGWNESGSFGRAQNQRIFMMSHTKAYFIGYFYCQTDEKVFAVIGAKMSCRFAKAFLARNLFIQM